MGIQEIFRSTGDHDLWQLCFWKQGSLFYQIKQIILRFYYKIFPKNRFGFSQQAGIHLRKSSAQRFHIQAAGKAGAARKQIGTAQPQLESAIAAHGKTGHKAVLPSAAEVKQTLAGIWQFLRDVRKIRKAHGHIRIKAALHLRHHQRYAIGIGISLRRSHTGPDIRVFPVPMQQVNSGTFRFRHSSPVKGKYHCKSGIHAQRLRTDGAFEKSHKKPPSPKIDRPICRPVAIF